LHSLLRAACDCWTVATGCSSFFSGLATGLSWICYFRALQLGEASRVAPIDKLSVVFAITFAAIILHEQLTSHQWAGGAFIVVGAAILAVKG
jgi:bacterial/archaeal transporter family protein